MGVEQLPIPFFGTNPPQKYLLLPPHLRKTVNPVLSLAQRMEEEQSLASAYTLEELNRLIPEINRQGIIFQNNYRPVARKQPSAHRMAELTDRLESYYAAGDVLAEALNDLLDKTPNRKKISWIRANDLVGRAAQAAAWETIKDIPGYENNPYLALFSLYALGATGVSRRTVDGKKDQLIVDVPLELDDRQVSACLLIPRDKEVLFVHGKDEDCSKARLIEPTGLCGVFRSLLCARRVC